MKQRKVWRYYCDHCKKGGCGKAAMLKHESSCTRNPARVCRMCKHGGLTQQPIESLREEVGSLDGLRKAARGCAACMLAAVMQEYPNRNLWAEESGIYVDFREEAKRFWDEVNRAAYERGGY